MISTMNLGTLDGVYRYPVKSMCGERLLRTDVGEHGVRGDRIYGLIDEETGKLASAKQPRAWSDLLKFTAQVVDEHHEIVGILSPGRISLEVPTKEATEFLRAYFRRPISVHRTAVDGILLDRTDPIAWVTGDDGGRAAIESHTIGRGAAAGSFFDFAPIHIVTTASLSQVRDLHPDSLSEVTRYRPNLLIRSPASCEGFVENEWIGSTIRVGAALELKIIMSSPRCVIPTLEQADLPQDGNALRVLVKSNIVDVPKVGMRPCLGVYAQVIVPGHVEQGDVVRIV